ncbi:MAG: trypsin-like peptidase domain-containing protein [Chthoniobacteraceae bacterium]
MKSLLTFFLIAAGAGGTLAQVDLTTEPTVIAVSRAMPAVVNINTERILKRRVRDPIDDFYTYFYGRQRPPRDIRQTVQSLGSGFLVDAAGYIVTNEHVVERAADLKISVTTNDGKTYEARYITGSQETDLAFIKIDGEKPFPFINIEDLSPNLLGQSVLVLGNPLGYGSSVARGILSARNRAVTVGEMNYKGLIQTDAAINPGNSGGPLVDLNGKLVGVSSVKMAFTPQGVPTQGLGFAIPGEVVRDRVREFTKTASAAPKAVKSAVVAQSLAKKYFGITMQDLTPDLARALSYEGGTGVVISDVEVGSPANVAGMAQGLVILGVGRYDAESVAQIESLLEPISENSLVDFTVSVASRVRGQIVRKPLTVTLKAR